MGDRVAHLITSRMLDFIEFDDGFAIAKVRAPRDTVGQTLADAALRTQYGITVVGVKRARRGLHLRPAGDRRATPVAAHRRRPDRQGRTLRRSNLSFWRSPPLARASGPCAASSSSLRSLRSLRSSVQTPRPEAGWCGAVAATSGTVWVRADLGGDLSGAGGRGGTAHLVACRRRGMPPSGSGCASCRGWPASPSGSRGPPAGVTCCCPRPCSWPAASALVVLLLLSREALDALLRAVNDGGSVADVLPWVVGMAAGLGGPVLRRHRAARTPAGPR